MIISIVNRSHRLSDLQVRDAVRAINRQLSEDFEPYWQFGATLRLDGSEDKVAHREGHVPLPRLPGRRGDAVIYIADAASLAGAEGYHDRNGGDVPFGFVFLDVCKAAGDNWTVALSHEAIELVADPMNNLLVQGPHPYDRSHLVFHMFELCDAVQGETYRIDGVEVSNFLLPGWFAHAKVLGPGQSVTGARNDFLGRPARGEVLQPFSLAPGGYLSFYDGRREGDKWTSVMPKDDKAAAKRYKAKQAAKLARVMRRCHPEIEVGAPKAHRAVDVGAASAIGATPKMVAKPLAAGRPAPNGAAGPKPVSARSSSRPRTAARSR